MLGLRSVQETRRPGKAKTANLRGRMVQRNLPEGEMGADRSNFTQMMTNKINVPTKLIS